MQTKHLQADRSCLVRAHLLRSPGALSQQKLAWFLVGSTTFALGCLSWHSLSLPWPKCWVRQIFGLPCPTCGSTHCALALLHGQFGRAFLLNPFMFLTYCAILISDAYAALVLAFGLKPWQTPKILLERKHALAIALCSALGVNWIYLLLYRN